MRKSLAIALLGAVWLTGGSAGAVTTEGDVARISGIGTNCAQGIFGYVVREGHLTRKAPGGAEGLVPGLKAPIKGNVFKAIDARKMLTFRLIGPGGTDVAGFGGFNLGLVATVNAGAGRGCD